MNMKRLSLSALVITGLVLGSMTTHVEAESFKPKPIVLTGLGMLLAANYWLDCKESVKNPETNHKLSDLWSLDWEKTVGAFDEIIIGQKAKGSSIKLTVGDKEIKETSKTPATGFCGQAHAHLTSLGKSSLDLLKVLVAPVLIISALQGRLQIVNKEGNLLPLPSFRSFKWLGTVSK